jgi:methionyl-tRNA formyltransferase
MGAIFLGTPTAAVPSLAALAQADEVDMVVTMPDRAKGRSQTPIPSPVKTAALDFGFRVEQPQTNSELLAAIKDSGATVGLVVAYGRLLSPEVLSSLPKGFVNVHFSLLPRWRGAAPVERAIAHGDSMTGVTLMKIDEGLDTGPVVAERATAITDDDTGGSLTARLAHIGAALVDDTLPGYLTGTRTPVPQISTGATHAAKLSKADAQITREMSVDTAHRVVRAFTPRPGAWVATDSGSIRILASTPSEMPGQERGMIGAIGDHVVLGCLDGGLGLTTVQPEGKQPMPANAWMNGRRGESVRLVAG